MYSRAILENCQSGLTVAAVTAVRGRAARGAGASVMGGPGSALEAALYAVMKETHHGEGRHLYNHGNQCR